MNIEVLLLIRRHTNNLIEQTRTRQQETLEFEKNKQVETFSLNPPINSVEEGNWLLAVTSLEVTNSVFNITDKNKSFSISIPGHWISESAQELIDEMKKFSEPRSQNDIELHVEQVRKKRINLLNNYSLSSLCTFKNEKLEELEISKDNDLEDMVLRL